MAKLSGRTKQALAVLLDKESDHKMIDSLYQRFDVDPLPTHNGFPTKLKKATQLTESVGKKADAFQNLVDYAASEASGMSPAFRRGRTESVDLYESLDQDLASARQRPAERQFTRPGTSAPMVSKPVDVDSRRLVFVVRGRDQKAYEALESFLLALDLRIVTWDDAVRECGGGTPSTLDIVRAGIRVANAVVVLMTPDDLGQVKDEFSHQSDDPREARLIGQARQNVIFEAGWAMALDQDHVVLVRVGEVRKLSDIDGLNYVNLSGDISSRKSLIGRLKNCKLDIDDTGEGWRNAGTFPVQM